MDMQKFQVLFTTDLIRGHDHDDIYVGLQIIREGVELGTNASRMWL